MRVGSALSEGVEEGQQGIAGLESTEAFAGGRNVLKRRFLGLEIRLNVHVSGFRALVSEPESDYGDIDPRLQ
jgi:hypothetical protein